VLLLITMDDNLDPQDNFLTYAPGGSGRFIVHSHDLPSAALQNSGFLFAFIPFEAPLVPATPDPS
jgi:hypothetical protein